MRGALGDLDLGHLQAELLDVAAPVQVDTLDQLHRRERRHLLQKVAHGGSDQRLRVLGGHEPSIAASDAAGRVGALPGSHRNAGAQPTATIASISTITPRGSPATATATRAGGASPKKDA